MMRVERRARPRDRREFFLAISKSSQKMRDNHEDAALSLSVSVSLGSTLDCAQGARASFFWAEQVEVENGKKKLNKKN